MTYRGDDLDLRLPPAWGGGPSSDARRGQIGEGQQPGFGQSGPIFVDDTLLSCCNHAFDVALAHRAAEVRIEHLLYALTRIDDAAAVLEANGIRDAGLRREVATVIASEIPIGLTNGKSTPHRSNALEEALRLAAAHAYRRKAPAGVADLLHVFFDIKPDLPGLDVLRRHAPAIGMERGGMERGSGFRDGGSLLSPPPPVFFTEHPAEPPRRPEPPVYSNAPVGGRGGIVPTAQDSIQNSRLDALEKMVRALGEDLSSERQMFSGALGELQRDVTAQRGDTNRFSSGLEDRLASIERYVSSGTTNGEPPAELMQRLNETRDSVTAFSDRLKAIEQAIRTQPDGGADFGAIEARLSDIETAILSADGSAGGRDPQLEDRLEALEETLATRLQGIEAKIGADTMADTDTSAAVQAELKALAGVVSTNANSAERLTANIQERLQSIQTANSESQGAIADLVGLVGQLGERLAAVEAQNRQAIEQAETARAEHVRELSDVHDAIMKLNGNQHALAETYDAVRQEEATALGAVTQRLTAIENNFESPKEELSRLSGNLDRMYRVTVERYHRRNRFWFWLLGTDDWIGASWPSQTARVEEELRALKQASEQA